MAAKQIPVSNKADVVQNSVTSSIGVIFSSEKIETIFNSMPKLKIRKPIAIFQLNRCESFRWMSNNNNSFFNVLKSFIVLWIVVCVKKFRRIKCLRLFNRSYKQALIR